jgi:serine protease
MRWVTRTKGSDGVPLRFPRLVMATAAIGLAVGWTALSSVPALADHVRYQEWWLAKLHVKRAWQTTRGSGVTVALLDTGVNPSPPDLSGSVITGPDYTKSQEKQGSQFFGVHGTAMASLIVGHGHGPGGLEGVMGVAPDARLLSVRVNLDGGDPLLSNPAVTSGLPDAIAAGIRYAVSNGAQVIDLPLDPGQTPSDLVAPPPPAPSPTPTPSPTAPPPPDGTAAEQAAVAYALSQGVVLVAPAGDNAAGTDAPNFPAGYPGVISVGAFNGAFVKAWYSSHQPYVTLTAPGDGMIAAVPGSYATTAGTSAASPVYATVASTSAASAVVTGIVALIKSQFPELTPAQVTQALTRSTVIRPSGGMTDGSGHGTADAAGALAAAAAIAAPGPQRAGAGAVSRQLPTVSASPLVSESLRPKLERDARISLAVLAVLLLPTIAYGLLQRRRSRARARARAEQERAARATYAPIGDHTADMMREYFAAPGGNTGSHGAGSLADSGLASADEAARRTGVQFPRSPLPPITRPATPRPAKVSGSPPWEPAPRPEGELPWVNTPAPAALNRRGAHAAPPISSVWAAASPGSPAPDATGPGSGDPGAGDGSAGSGGRPIYVWNPGDTTDNFPQVPREGRDGGS